MKKVTGSQRLYNWLRSVEKRGFDSRFLKIESYQELIETLVDPNDCQLTDGIWNQEDKTQERYLIDIESDRVFCLHRASADLRWSLDHEVDFSSILAKK